MIRVRNRLTLPVPLFRLCAPVVAAAALTLAPASARAQLSTGHQPQPQSSMGDPTVDPHVPRTPTALQEKMAIQRNDERQRKLVADTEKLLALATQLKTDVDKTDKYMLSLEVIKRSEEIEKLAREIKDRAKN